jgi:hypothetical protein
MRLEYHVVFLRHATAIPGEIRKLNSLDPKSKVPFITDRLQSKLHCLLRMRTERHVV